MTNCEDSSGAIFNQPSGIAIVGSYAFITNSKTNGNPKNSVSVCTINGKKLESCKNSCGTGFDQPYSIAINGGVAFVTNRNSNSVSACDLSGDTLSNCVDSGVANSYPDIDKPVDIAINGNVAYITSSGNNVVIACTIVSGKQLQSCVDSGGTGFNKPFGIAL